MKEDYLGDGLYVSTDGWQIRLRAPREGGDHEVYFDQHTLKNFLDWLKAEKERGAA